MSVYFEFEKRLHFLWIVEDINGRGTFYVNRRLKRIYTDDHSIIQMVNQLLSIYRFMKVKVVNL